MPRLTPNYSDPSIAEPPAGTRFHTWENGPDPYDHTQLTANWDRLDAIIGRPTVGGQWPATEGVGGGLWREIENVKGDNTLIGTVIAWYSPNLGIYTVPTGWVACIGQTLTAGNHDFPGIAGSVILPDLRNRYIVGADAALTAGGVGSNLNTSAGAPAIVAPTGGTDGNGTHNSLGGNLSNLPHHYHDHSHTHNSTIVATSRATQAESGSLATSVDSGTVHGPFASKTDHAHSITDKYSSTPKDDNHSGGYVPPDGPVANPRVGTSLQKTPTTITDVTRPTGGTAGDLISINNQPLSVGLIYIMKVKYTS